MDLVNIVNVANMCHNHFIMMMAVCMVHNESSRLLDEERLGRTAIPRVRISVDEIHDHIGPQFFRRAYRMTYNDFKLLLSYVSPYLSYSKCKKGRNGPVPHEFALSATIRFLAGGAVYDIMQTHGISHATLYNCIWHVIAAINKSPFMKIKFPRRHEQQMKLAGEFKKKSQAGFGCCVGCIDGMLLWIEKPTVEDCRQMKTGDAKFHCTRKGNFGFNLQAVCDAHGRFTSVWIKTPGATSDFLSFLRSDLYFKLENKLLKEGLVIFGDSAYVSNDYMVTPYRKGRGGNRDDFNYYQSQLRIIIECAFGILVQRWSILRSPLSAIMGGKKQIALAFSACRLHNFCITQRLERGQTELGGEESFGPDLIEQMVGGYAVGGAENDPGIPYALLDGGAHFDDVDDGLLPRVERSLPRLRLRQLVASKGLRRKVLPRRN